MWFFDTTPAGRILNRFSKVSNALLTAYGLATLMLWKLETCKSLLSSVYLWNFLLTPQLRSFTLCC